MEDLTELMRHVRQDLARLQESLNWAAMQRNEEGGPPTPAGVGFEEITAFKGAIDDMRHFLWAYIEGLSKGDYALQTFRMQRATEMLRALRNDMETSPMPPAPETHTFFEALNRIAGEILAKHLEDK